MKIKAVKKTSKPGTPPKKMPTESQETQRKIEMSCDRNGEAAMAAKAAIEASKTSVGSMPTKINAKEMRGDCYTAEGRIKGDK